LSVCEKTVKGKRTKNSDLKNLYAFIIINLIIRFVLRTVVINLL